MRYLIPCAGDVQLSSRDVNWLKGIDSRIVTSGSESSYVYMKWLFLHMATCFAMAGEDQCDHGKGVSRVFQGQN
jgi:hypothetical protein